MKTILFILFALTLLIPTGMFVEAQSSLNCPDGSYYGKDNQGNDACRDIETNKVVKQLPTNQNIPQEKLSATQKTQEKPSGSFFDVLLSFFKNLFGGISSNSIEESLQSIPDSIPEDVLDNIPSSIELPIQELTGKTVQTIEQTSEEIQNYAEEIGKPSETTSEESREAIDYINQLRLENDRPAIKWDSRVFALAGAWSQELYETGQFDHTNPVTGNCPALLKGEYGLSSIEDVADNLHATSYGYDGTDPILSNPNAEESIDGWMNSVGHRYNLLFHDHTAGAYACHGGICSFMGLNHVGYGGECSTAAEGKAQFAKLASCTSQQLSQYDNMMKSYSDEVEEYNSKVPAVSNSQSEYQYYMNWANELDSKLRAIENFRC